MYLTIIEILLIQGAFRNWKCLEPAGPSAPRVWALFSESCCVQPFEQPTHLTGSAAGQNETACCGVDCLVTALRMKNYKPQPPPLTPGPSRSCSAFMFNQRGLLLKGVGAAAPHHVCPDRHSENTGEKQTNNSDAFLMLMKTSITEAKKPLNKNSIQMFNFSAWLWRERK